MMCDKKSSDKINARNKAFLLPFVKNMKEFFATWNWNVDEQDAFELFFIPLPFFSTIIITIIII